MQSRVRSRFDFEDQSKLQLRPPIINKTYAQNFYKVMYLKRFWTGTVWTGTVLILSADICIHFYCLSWTHAQNYLLPSKINLDQNKDKGRPSTMNFVLIYMSLAIWSKNVLKKKLGPSIFKKSPGKSFLSAKQNKTVDILRALYIYV